MITSPIHRLLQGVHKIVLISIPHILQMTLQLINPHLMILKAVSFQSRLHILQQLVKFLVRLVQLLYVFFAFEVI